MCEKPFSRSSSSKSSQKDGAWWNKTNFDFVETLSEILEFPCDQYAKKSKRKDILKRHIKTVHNQNANFNCPSCDRQFKSKDKLGDQIGIEHSEAI